MTPVHLSPVIASTSRSMSPDFAVRSLEFGDEPSSPVLAVDDFRVSGRPFGPHPHAGFSAMTYVFRDSPGRLRNRDSLGAHFVVGPGGLCWLQAGSGAMHEEIPADAQKPLHGLQVFVNLSAEHKLSTPHTYAVDAERVPLWKSPAGDEVRVVVGTHAGLTSPVAPLEPFTLLDVTLVSSVQLELGHRHNAVVYVRRGEVVVDAGGTSRTVAEGQAVVGSGGGLLQLTGQKQADVIVLSGTGLDERIVMQGPFVMNEPSQIDAAMVRYRAGQMGSLEPYREG